VRTSGDRLAALTFTVEQVATLLGISRTTAYESVRRGEIPAVRLGQRLVVPQRAVAEMLGIAPDELITSATVAVPRPRRRADQGRARPTQGALWQETGPGSAA
jgi:excisionase family DNA binding protein